MGFGAACDAWLWSGTPWWNLTKTTRVSTIEDFIFRGINFFLYNKHHTVEHLRVNETWRAAKNGCCGSKKLCLKTQPFGSGMIVKTFLEQSC